MKFRSGSATVNPNIDHCGRESSIHVTVRNNQAKIPIANENVGVIGKAGELTNWIGVTRTNTGFVHGWPSLP